MPQSQHVGLDSQLIHTFRGLHGRGIHLRYCFNDLRSSEPDRAAILAKSNMAAIQLDVKHKYKTFRARLIHDSPF